MSKSPWSNRERMQLIDCMRAVGGTCEQTKRAFIASVLKEFWTREEGSIRTKKGVYHAILRLLEGQKNVSGDVAREMETLNHIPIIGEIRSRKNTQREYTPSKRVVVDKHREFGLAQNTILDDYSFQSMSNDIDEILADLKQLNDSVCLSSSNIAHAIDTASMELGKLNVGIYPECLQNASFQDLEVGIEDMLGGHLHIQEILVEQVGSWVETFQHIMSLPFEFPGSSI